MFTLRILVSTIPVALVLSALGCGKSRIEAHVPRGLLKSQEIPGACPLAIEGFWGVEKGGKPVPIAIFDRTQDGDIRYTDLETDEIVLVADAEPQPVDETTSANLDCMQGKIRMQFSTTNELTVKIWSFDIESGHGTIETIYESGRKFAKPIVFIPTRTFDKQ